MGRRIHLAVCGSLARELGRLVEVYGGFDGAVSYLLSLAGSVRGERFPRPRGGVTAVVRERRGGDPRFQVDLRVPRYGIPVGRAFKGVARSGDHGLVVLAVVPAGAGDVLVVYHATYYSSAVPDPAVLADLARACIRRLSQECGARKVVLEAGARWVAPLIAGEVGLGARGRAYPFPIGEIVELLRKGRSIDWVYRYLVRRGKICRARRGALECMKYQTFRRKLRSILKHLEGSSTPSSAS